MKTTAFLVIAALIGQSEAFSTVHVGFHASSNSRPSSSALKDTAILDQVVQGGGDQMMVAAGGAAAAIAAAAAALFGNKNGASATASDKAAAEPEAIDVSIPYNSAAMLAFSETKLPKSKFAEFESLYLAKSVADVTAKKMARDVVEMENVAAKLAKDLEALSA
mmetsp:Transcript_29435/g.70770  ORF Transcript_29435/g.70770 Transcript_29435/m.70770 type:complete len:164 (+) Transcript_29435:75-566(+)